ncbi:PorP/SprF family type IX secretion system membrane protein [Schleiferiaceae bacterium]|jgi:type IX secretion system PorP/SprF family membrane protein|nr:PorP/SprF family type IX secretion system membrane protein [Schleiferiaceae bacterium]
MKKTIILAIGMMAASMVHAQQDPHLALYVFNPTMYNPAYAGNAQDPQLSLAYRNQWQGISGAPATLFAAGQGMVTDALGSGLMIQSDQLGPIQMTSVATDLNYRIRVSEQSKLAVGLRLGMSNYNEALTDLYVTDPNDPIFQSDINQWLPMVGYGAMVYGDRYYVSFSSPGIIRSAQHFYASGGFAIPIHPEWDFRMSSQFKIVSNAPGSLDLSPAFVWKRMYTIGSTFRPGSAMGAWLHVRLANGMSLGYSMERTTSDLAPFGPMSHDIVLSIPLYLPGKAVTSPRYF